MDAIGRHIEHIRAIVQVHQMYARTSLMTEECDLALLIKDALRIQLPALQRHGVAIQYELAAVPRARSPCSAPGCPLVCDWIAS